MKKLYLLLVLAISSTSIFSQTPQYIPYQAVARNAAGNLLVNQPVGLRFTIRESSGTGTIDYQETQTATTNSLGLFAANIGSGSVVTGTFSGIPWGNGIAKYTQVEIDPTGGTSYASLGAAQMMSVPYALYAGTATSAAGTHTNGSGLTGGSYNGSTGVTWAVQSLNGLNTNATDNAVELGGTLTKSTTITQAGFNMIDNLTGTGDFEIEENSSPSLYVLGAHSATTDGFVGIGIASPNAPLQVNSSSSTALPSGILNLFQPNLPANGSVYIKLGTGLSTNNEADLAFTNVSSGSTSNSFTIGFYGTGGIANFAANGNVKLTGLAGTGNRPVYANSSGVLTTGGALPGQTLTKVPFSYTGGIQSWTVPGNVTQVYVKLWGAGGGGVASNGPGGGGGFVSGVLPVTPGNIYYIVVGGGGQTGRSNAYGGGGAGSGSGAGGGGGGRSAIMTSSSNSDVVTAGGGGGGAHDCYCYGGGGGGGLVGGYTSSGNCPGAPGTQSAGGSISGGSCQSGGSGYTAGAQYSGGSSCTSTWGGGGGGGWYGGAPGGCTNNEGSGGGGSSYISGLNLLYGYRNEQGSYNNNVNTSGASSTTYLPGGYYDTDYGSGIGTGGSGASTPAAGGNGYVVIYY